MSDNCLVCHRPPRHPIPENTDHICGLCIQYFISNDKEDIEADGYSDGIRGVFRNEKRF